MLCKTFFWLANGKYAARFAISSVRISYQRILFTQKPLPTLRRDTASTPTSQQQQNRWTVLPDDEGLPIEFVLKNDTGPTSF